MGKHSAETKSQRSICFSLYLYRARNLIERFFNRISNVGVLRPDVTGSRPTSGLHQTRFDPNLVAC